MTENAITWEAIAGIVGVVTLTIVLATVAVGYGRLKGSHDATNRRAERANEKADEVAAELFKFKEQAAREFASVTTLEKVEERVVGAIDRLGDRLDRFFEGKPHK